MSHVDFESYRLEAEVFPEYTLESTFRQDHQRGLFGNIQTKWERAERLGRGTFGSEVWCEHHYRKNGSNRTIEKARAVKIIDKEQIKRYNIDFKRDILATAKYSKDEHLQKKDYSSVFLLFNGWYENRDFIFLSMEYFQYGDLSQYTDFTEDDVRNITRDLLHALSILQDEKLIHGDLKPQNIFVLQKRPEYPTWRVKLGDFGFTKRVKDHADSLDLRSNTRQFLAPEVYDESYERSSQADVWSLGCIIFTISAGQVPFPRPFDAIRYCEGRRSFPDDLLSGNMTKLGVQFVRKCLMPESSERITIDGALDDLWVLNRSQAKRRSTNITVRNTSSSSNNTPFLGKPVCLQDNYIEPQQPISKDITALPQRPAKIPHVEKPQSSRLTPREIPIPSRRDSVPLIQISSPVSQESHAVEIEIADRDSQETIAFRSLRQEEKSAEYLAMPDMPSALGRAFQSHELRANFKTSGKLDGHQGTIYTVALSPNGRLLASGSSDKTIKIRDRATGKLITTLAGHSEKIRSVAFSPSGKLLASGSDDQTTRIWDVEDAAKAVLLCILKHGCERSVALGPKGKPLTNSLSPQFWMEQVLSTAHIAFVSSVAFSPDRKLLASGLGDATVRLWNVEENQPSDVVRGHKGWIFTVAFSPDGKVLASGSADTTIRLWDVAKSKLINVLYGHKDAVSSVAFSPDGKLLASGSWDCTIRLWDTAKGQLVTNPWRGHEITITQVAFSPFMNVIVSSSADGTVRFWNLDGQFLLKLGETIPGIDAITLSDDAELLIGAQSDTIRVWGVSDETVRHFEKLNKRQLAEREGGSKRQSLKGLPKRFTWS